MSCLIALILLLVTAPSLFSAQEDAALEEFMRRLAPMAQHPRVEASFVQVRRFSAINFEMKTTGKMSAEPGKMILWETLTPARSKCTMKGDSCTFWDEHSGKTTTLPAKEHPWVAMIFRLSNSWVSPDLKALQKEFSITQQDSHTLRLTPLSKGIADIFASIQVTFSQDFSHVQQIVFTEKKGKDNDTITIDFQHK